jgi:hypothetical protein
MIGILIFLSLIVLTIILSSCNSKAFGGEKSKNGELYKLIQLIVNSDSLFETNQYPVLENMLTYTLELSKYTPTEINGIPPPPPPPPVNYFDYLSVKYELNKYLYYQISKADSISMVKQIKSKRKKVIKTKRFDRSIENKNNFQTKYLYEFYVPIYLENENIVVVEYNIFMQQNSKKDFYLRKRAYLRKVEKKWELKMEYVLW